MENTNKKVIEISTNTIFKVLAIIFALWVLYLIKDVVAILFFAVILISIFEPWVLWLNQRKIPKSLAVILVYLAFLALIALVFVMIIPPIIDQTQQLLVNFPAYWAEFLGDLSLVSALLNKYGISADLNSYLKNLALNLSIFSGDVFSKISGFFAGIISIFIVLVITFYTLVQENATKGILRSILPSHYLPYAFQMLNKVQKKLGLWLRGQMILCFLVALLVYIGLFLLNVKYAMVLAIVAGLLEFIPYLGPTFAGFLAVVITFFQSPLEALLVLLLYVFVQIVENNILVPNIMQKAVGLNPVVSILALLIGAKLGGVFGAILAIPLTTALSVLVQDVFGKNKTEDIGLNE